MRKALALSKLYINSLFGITGFIEELKGLKKAAFKKLGLAILIMFSFSSLVAAFVMFDLKLYKLLAPINQERVVITYSIIISTILLVIFGIITVISNYFVNQEGDIILALPFKNWHLLFSKFATSYVIEFITSFIIMSTGCIVYGVLKGEGIVFYLSYFLVSLILPIIPLALSYLVVIPVMKIGGFLRNKDFLMIFSGVLAILFAIVYQVVFQKMFMVQNDPEALMKIFTSPDGLIATIGKIYYPSIWGTFAITNLISAKGILSLLAIIGVSFGILLILLYGMSGAYYRSIIGSSEVRKSTKKITSDELKSSLRSEGIMATLVKREIRLMNREPIYLLNGPLIILLMPIILFFSFYFQRAEIMKDLGFIMEIKSSYRILITATAGAWLGVTTNITPTCISREGKMFPVIKSLPIDPMKFINAKLIHGFIFSIIGSLMGGILGLYILKLSFGSFLFALVISLLLQIPFLQLGLLCELKWPYLIWDNPQKPMKQNPNAIVVTLTTMFGMPAAIFFAIKFIESSTLIYLIFTIIPLVLAVLLQIFILKYAVKRFYEIEV